METVNTTSPKNDQPTYAMLADMRDRALLAERERDEARQWESQALVARIQRDQFSKTLGEVREILCEALPNENQLTSSMAVKLARERDEAREIVSRWRDNWKKCRTVSMIASIKLPWENAGLSHGAG